MSSWNKSSLAFSDGMSRNNSILKPRISKQNFMEHKMFGSKRKGILIGKNFKKVGKGIMKSSTSGGKMPKSSGISPDIGEFDKMMSSITGVKSNKKSMFNRKQFG